MKKLYLLLLLAPFFLLSCEDPAPNDYVQEIIVQSYLIVDEPINNFLVMRSLSVQDSFDLKKALIKDAEVIIRGDGKEFILTYNAAADSSIETAGYYLADQTYLVKPETEYSMIVKLKDGTIITDTTKTPTRFSWVKRPNKFLQYPVDTLKLPSTDTIQWSPARNTLYYLLSIKALDTINYGKYYDKVPLDEKNRKIERPWTDDDYFTRRTSWAFIPNIKTPVVWSVFKWFGLHETVVYAPDPNMLQWFLQHSFSAQYNPLFTTVNGAIGVFGSASVQRDTSFLIKNQP